MLDVVLALMNSCLTNKYMHVLNPTVTFQVGDISRIPLKCVTLLGSGVKTLIDLSKKTGIPMSPLGTSLVSRSYVQISGSRHCKVPTYNFVLNVMK